ncbi:hypothetical protein CRENBAI_002067 [Crenichthys baileyi]|uniref:Uncharacterized protein n=1 Tax=Crenichthys baileyi TaxID=28760 RepID=A0AAV9S2F9_9TELE
MVQLERRQVENFDECAHWIIWDLMLITGQGTDGALKICGGALKICGGALEALKTEAVRPRTPLEQAGEVVSP